MPPNPYAMCTFTCDATAGFPSCDTVSSREHGPAPPSITGVIGEESAADELEFCFWRGVPGLAATVKVRARVKREVMAKTLSCFMGDPNVVDRTSLENFLAEGRKRKLHGQVGSLIVFVDHWIHFDNLEAQQPAMVGDDFHGEVRFAIRRATPHGSADAWCVFRIDPVHIERHVIAGRDASGHAKSFFHHGSHAAFIDIAHGENFHASTPDILFF